MTGGRPTRWRDQRSRRRFATSPCTPAPRVAARLTNAACSSSSTVSLLNGVVYGLLLFMLTSGLTLIFSMMGVLNFAHASVFMLGAYFSFQFGRWIGFWPALVHRAAAVRRCRRGHRALRSAPRARERTRRRDPVHVRPRLPDRGARDDGLGPQRRREQRARGHRFLAVHACSAARFPAYKGLMMAISVAMFVFLYLALKRTRIGLVIQAALTHPQMVGALGTRRAGRVRAGVRDRQRARGARPA